MRVARSIGTKVQLQEEEEHGMLGFFLLGEKVQDLWTREEARYGWEVEPLVLSQQAG